MRRLIEWFKSLSMVAKAALVGGSAAVLLGSGCCVGTIALAVLFPPQPPKMTIVSPTDGSTVSTRFVDLSVTTDPPGSKVAVNGKAVSGGKIELEEGENVLAIQAVDPSNGKSATKKVAVAFVVPEPALTITEPAGGSKASDSAVKVSGSVNDNGVEVAVTNMSAKGSSASTCEVEETEEPGFVSQPVKLRAGPNKLRVVAKNASGQDTETLQVVWNPECSVTISQPNWDQRIASSRVVVRGETARFARVTCGGRSTRADRRGRFAIGVPVRRGKNEIRVRAGKANYKKGSATVTVTRVETPAEYRASCRRIPYKVLEKDADRLKGTRVFYRGQVFNIEETYGTTVIQLYVTNQGYDIWTDQVWVVHNGRVKAYNNDIIRVWGKVAGSETYESQAGWNMTVPKVQAKYISK